MAKHYQFNSIQSEREVLSEYIELQFMKTDSRKRKVIAQAKAVKHAQAVLSNNNNQKDEVKHG